MKKIGNQQYAEALYVALQNLKGADLKKAATAFVALLARDHKLKQAESIIASFNKYAKKMGGIKEIEIQSARELEEKTVGKIKRTFGEHVEAKLKVAPELLGGIRVVAEDKILDASLKTQLLNLKQKLI